MHLSTTAAGSGVGPGTSAACPNPENCLDLMARYGMLENIREHSLQVRAVALALGTRLALAGNPVNLPLLEAGALLHDLAKTATLQNGGDHASLGAIWLEEMGYPEVARIVRMHVYLPDELLHHPRVCEAQLVNYADKRVQHDRVVTLGARFDDLRVRYGRGREAIIVRITANENRSRILEAKIFDAIPLTPEDLLELNTARRLP